MVTISYLDIHRLRTHLFEYRIQDLRGQTLKSGEFLVRRELTKQVIRPRCSHFHLGRLLSSNSVAVADSLQGLVKWEA